MKINIATTILKKYGFLGSLRLIRDVIISRAVFRDVRIIRYPWYIRGKSKIKLGRKFTCGVGLRLDAFGLNNEQIFIGENVEIGDYVHIGAIESVRIGDNCLLASKIYISDHDHGSYSGNDQTPLEILQRNKKIHSRPVVIENNVWIGESVIILKGVRIGVNSIVGAGSVVVKDIPENTISVGSPSRVIKKWCSLENKWISNVN